MYVLLFDIDGTLIRSGGAGKLALHGAISRAFGVNEIRDEVSFAGRTDPGIGIDLLRVHGLDATEANLARLAAAYLELLPESLIANQGVVLPGVARWLDKLSQTEHVHLGLLTGNVRRGAELKLKHYDLWDYFEFGGFADDMPRRDDIARLALLETERHLGIDVDPRCVWVIGDTPHDITCARAIGANVIAVTTGWHTREELESYGADHVVESLATANHLLQTFLTPPM